MNASSEEPARPATGGLRLQTDELAQSNAQKNGASFALLRQEIDERRRAEEEVSRLNLDLALLNHVIVATASTLDVAEALSLGCDVLAHAFDMPHATVLLLDEEHTHFTTAAEFSWVLLRSRLANAKQSKAREASDVLGEAILAAGVPLSEYILAHKTLLVIGDAQHDPRLVHVHAMLRERGVVSILIVPILIRDEIAGVIELNTPRQRPFSDQDLMFARSVATAIGQVMETAQLYQELQRHADHLEEIVAWRTLELQTERDRTRSILEAVGEAVVVTDVDGTIEYMNPAAAELTGFTSAEALGKNWTLWQSSPQGVFGSERRADLGQVQALVRSGQMWRGEVVNRRKDGTLYDAALTVAPLFDPHDPEKPIGFVSVQRDITPVKEAERLKDQFVSNVSHELRTPLSVITLLSGNFDTLYDRLSEDRRRKMVQDIRAHTQTLNELIGSVLDISRIDSKRISMERERLDLAVLARQEAEKQLPLAQKKSQTLRVTGVKHLRVPGNGNQLRQVIRNLLNNAIKYTPEGGRITCECLELVGKMDARPEWPGSTDLPPGRWAALCVADTGIGIRPQDLPHLFERFYRVKAQGNIPGTGLGLSIARELVELHGGHIAVASTPGQGSRFVVYLPLAPTEGLRLEGEQA